MVIETKKLTEIKEEASTVAASFSERDSLYTEVDNAFHLIDNSLPTDDHIKRTISPNARNKTLGAIRLLTASEPFWSAKIDNQNAGAEKISNKIERFAAECFRGSGKVQGKPIHYDLVTTAVLYGQVDMGVALTADLVKIMQGADKKRAERAQRLTPLLFEVYNPRVCYPVRDNLGLSAHYIRRKMSVVQIKSRWGEDAFASLNKQVNPYEVVTYHEFWNNEYHAAWTDEVDLSCEAHGMDFIPISSAVAEGSDLWEGTDYESRQPFLYTLLKSNIWSRENMALTAINTWVAAIGGNPKFVFRRANPEKSFPEPDWNSPDAIVIDQGEEYGPVNRQVVDPSLQLAFQLAQELDTQSTIYAQTLGEPLGANAPFSMVSMLNQAGRLPLVPYQRACNFVTGDIMRKGFELLRQAGGKQVLPNAQEDGGDLELDIKELPKTVSIEARYEIDMPQDKRQSVAIASQATQGENPLLSTRYAREEYLGVGQSDDMDREIWNEKYTQTMFNLELQKMAAMAQAQVQTAVQQMQAQMQQAMQPPQMPMQGTPTPPQQTKAPQPQDLIRQLSQANQGGEPGMEGMPMAAPQEPGMTTPPSGEEEEDAAQYS